MSFVYGTLLLSQSATAQFVWQPAMQPRENGTSFALNCFSCEGNNCVAAGMIHYDDSQPRHIIIHSTDGGQTWSQTKLYFRPYAWDGGDRINRIQQIDSLNIIAVGDTLIYRSTDAGATWNDLPVPRRTNYIRVHFSDPQTGCILASSELFFTRDAGKHWDSIWFIGYDRNPNDCHSDGGPNFRALTIEGVIYETHDNWVHYDSTLPISVDIGNDGDPGFGGWTITGDTIYAYGARHYRTGQTGYGRGLLATSSDRGKHWKNVEMADTLSKFVCCTSQLDRDTIFVGGISREKVLRSNDRGKSWFLDSVICPFQDTAFDFGLTSGIHLTTDGHPVGLFAFSYTESGITELSFVARGYPPGELAVRQSEQRAQANVYPNPAVNTVKVVGYTKGNIEVLDALGRTYTMTNHVGSLDVSSLPAGVYYVSDGKQRAKFVKE